MVRIPLRSTLFPYTTLFRSLAERRLVVAPHHQLPMLGRLVGQVPLREVPGDGIDRRSPPRPDLAPRRLRLARSEEHTSELQSRQYLVCRLLLETKRHS